MSYKPASLPDGTIVKKGSIIGINSQREDHLHQGALDKIVRAKITTNVYKCIHHCHTCSHGLRFDFIILNEPTLSKDRWLYSCSRSVYPPEMSEKQTAFEFMKGKL